MRRCFIAMLAVLVLSLATCLTSFFFMRHVAREMEAVRTLVKETMENVVELRVPLVVDAQYGANWGQAH